MREILKQGPVEIFKTLGGRESVSMNQPGPGKR